MAFDPLTGLFGASVVGGLVDTFVGASSSSKNYKAQKEALEWQKYAQRTTWEREDNAVRRRVADLRSAGLSPVLAAGQGAQASGPIQVTAPQYNKQWSIGQALDKAGMALQLMQGKENIAYTRAQKDLVDLQKKVLEHDYNIMRSDGMSSNPSSFSKNVRDLIQLAITGYKRNSPSNSAYDSTGEKYDFQKQREDYIQNFKEKWRAEEAKKVHQKYQKEYAERQAYEAGSRRSFSRNK